MREWGILRGEFTVFYRMNFGFLKKDPQSLNGGYNGFPRVIKFLKN